MIPFARDFEAPYGEPVTVSPLIRRVLARNPGPFTFKGTSTAIVGHGRVAVIDPGPDDPAHLAALRRALAGETVTHILVTHTHRDHSSAAHALQAWCGAPTYGFGPHPNAAGAGGIEEGADRVFMPDRRVTDGMRIAGAGFAFACVHTPGHIGNHVCYALEEEKALFSGDHVMAWSTSVIAPPDGDMAAYFASLEKLLARDDRIYWPAHGGPVRDPPTFVAAYLAHRKAREAQIAALVADGVATVPDIAARAYTGLDPRLGPAARLSVLAHLVKLCEEGRVIGEPGPTPDAYFRPAP